MAITKRPAGSSSEAQPGKVAKKPAAAWSTWAEEPAVEPDTSGVTPQQRYIFEKNLKHLPQEIQTDFAEAKASAGRGKQKIINSIMNSVVPKDMAMKYKDEITIDQALMTRYRTFVATRSQGTGSQGLTRTEMLGPGKLGSEQLLQQGLASGDVISKVVNGKELFWMARAWDHTSFDDSHGRSVSGTARSSNADFFASALQAAKDEFADEPWFAFAVGDAKPQELRKPASEGALHHLQDAYDALQMKVRSVKRLCAQTLNTGGNAHSMGQQVLQDLREFERKKVNNVEALMFKQRSEISDQEVKACLVDTARELEKVMRGEKELRAILRV